MLNRLRPDQPLWGQLDLACVGSSGPMRYSDFSFRDMNLANFLLILAGSNW